MSSSVNQRCPEEQEKKRKHVETDLDGTVEEAIVLSGSVEKTFGVGGEDLMRRVLGHADLLMFRCLAVFTRKGGHRNR